MERKAVVIKGNNAYSVVCGEDVDVNLASVLNGIEEGIVRMVGVGKAIWNDAKQKWGISDWTVAGTPAQKIPHNEVIPYNAPTTPKLIIMQREDAKYFNDHIAKWLHKAANPSIGKLADVAPVGLVRLQSDKTLTARMFGADWEVFKSTRGTLYINPHVACYNCGRPITGKARVNVGEDNVVKVQGFQPDGSAINKGRKWYCDDTTGCTQQIPLEDDLTVGSVPPIVKYSSRHVTEQQVRRLGVAVKPVSEPVMVTQTFVTSVRVAKMLLEVIEREGNK